MDCLSLVCIQPPKQTHYCKRHLWLEARQIFIIQGYCDNGDDLPAVCTFIQSCIKYIKSYIGLKVQASQRNLNSPWRKVIVESASHMWHLIYFSINTYIYIRDANIDRTVKQNFPIWITTCHHKLSERNVWMACPVSQCLLYLCGECTCLKANYALRSS